MNLSDYKACFERLQSIAYRHIDISGTGLRVLGIHYMDYGSDWSVKKHKHTFYEFHYVSEGYTYTAINNVESRIQAGSFYLMPPGTYHSHRQDLQCGHKGIALRWEFIERVKQAELQDGPASEISKIRNTLRYAHSNPIENNTLVMDGIKRLLEMACANCGVLWLQLEFCQLLINIAGCYAGGICAKQSGINYTFFENKTVESAIRFMEENFSNDISVNDVAGCVHLSYSHLARLFKKHTGSSVVYHLNKLRLKKAQWLLGCSDKSITEIAREVGYSNEHYFCTTFKKFFKMTPGTYRNTRSNLSE